MQSSLSSLLRSLPATVNEPDRLVNRRICQSKGRGRASLPDQWNSLGIEAHDPRTRVVRHDRVIGEQHRSGGNRLGIEWALPFSPNDPIDKSEMGPDRPFA